MNCIKETVLKNDVLYINLGVPDLPVKTLAITVREEIKELFEATEFKNVKIVRVCGKLTEVTSMALGHIIGKMNKKMQIFNPIDNTFYTV